MNVPDTNVTASMTPKMEEIVRLRFRRTSRAARGSRPNASLRCLERLPDYKLMVFMPLAPRMLELHLAQGGIRFEVEESAEEAT